MSQLLPVLTDDEIFEERHPFATQALTSLATFLNRLACKLTWGLPETAGTAAAQPAAVAGGSFGRGLGAMPGAMPAGWGSSSEHSPAAAAHASALTATELREKKSLRDASLRLLSLLADRDARAPFVPPDDWLAPQVRDRGSHSISASFTYDGGHSLLQLRYSELHRELFDGRPRAKRLLASMPWVLPFERRCVITNY